MNTQPNIYIFVEKNMGHGFETVYPCLPKWHLLMLKCLIRGCKTGFSKKYGFTIFHRIEIDHDCLDPRAKGRSPKIDMTAVFPWKFNENHLFSVVGNDLLEECWRRTLNVSLKGENPQMALQLPEKWYK